MKEIFDEFSDIIKTIESSYTAERYGFEFSKMKLILVEGSSLRIWEKRFKSSVQRYSYYWLDELDNQIIGWDNAPHHPEIETFPHHKHMGRNVFPSEDRLIDVLKYIASRLR